MAKHKRDDFRVNKGKQNNMYNIYICVHINVYRYAFAFQSLTEKEDQFRAE